MQSLAGGASPGCFKPKQRISTKCQELYQIKSPLKDFRASSKPLDSQPHFSLELEELNPYVGKKNLSDKCFQMTPTSAYKSRHPRLVFFLLDDPMAQ